MSQNKHTLGEPFYLNVARCVGEPSKWYPCWNAKYVGSGSRTRAINLRNEWLLHLQNTGNPNWKADELKTVKVLFYQ